MRGKDRGSNDRGAPEALALGGHDVGGHIERQGTGPCEGEQPHEDQQHRSCDLQARPRRFDVGHRRGHPTDAQHQERQNQPANDVHALLRQLLSDLKHVDQAGERADGGGQDGGAEKVEEPAHLGIAQAAPQAHCEVGAPLSQEMHHTPYPSAQDDEAGDAQHQCKVPYAIGPGGLAVEAHVHGCLCWAHAHSGKRPDSFAIN
mmetsp:Transcript_52124/g.150219  ORF Transcript_52124/g.150219 Transcript_52124/m.150219 type:complete len:203 (+) Transcript_52124:301-909(+)